MFNKKQSIEDDYIQYNSDETIQEKHEKKSILSTIIKLLTIMLLLGLLTIGGIFAYKYLQNTIEQEKVKTTDTTPISVPKVQEEHKKEQKMYTQDEMQAIVQTMMENIQKTQETKTTTDIKAEETTGEIKTQENTKTDKKGDESTLISSLEEIAVDEIDEEIDTLDTLEQKDQEEEIMYENAILAKNKHYNKVVVNSTNSSYDNIDEISTEIKKVMREMNQNKPITNSTYTSAISEEVSTREDEMRVIIVRRGDTLSKIAKRAYGSAMAYSKIYRANPDLIKNPNHIYIGQRLRVPLSKNN